MRYLGIDFGLKRVGLATSEGQIASCGKVIAGSGFQDLLNKLIKESSGFDQLVIGMPEGKMGKVIKKVVKSLRSLDFKVIETDETLSTQQATSQMVTLNIPKKKRRVNDAYSASIILQNYLDTHNLSS